MRVLMLIDWNRGHGGAEAHALLTRDALRAAGDDVRLLTSSAGSAADGKADYVAYGTERPIEQAFLQIANPLAAATVRRAVRELDPDVVWVNMFAHHLSPSAVRAVGDRPVVLLVSDYKLICPVGSKLLPDGSFCHSRAGWACRASGCTGTLHWLRDRPRYVRLRAAAARARRVLACSEWVTAELAREGIAAETLYWPTPPPAPSFVRRPAEQPAFLYFGRLDREKGVDLLLRAFARLLPAHPEARLDVVGRGPERERLEALSRELGAANAVRFHGWKSRGELEEPLSGAWAAIAPSRWAEPFGLVAVEAIVRGVPSIVSAAGGLAEIVEPGVTGLRFAPGDEDDLLRQLEQVASGSAFPERSLSGPAVAAARRRFSVQLHIERLRAVFEEAVAA